jgi:hypothetical protein
LRGFTLSDREGMVWKPLNLSSESVEKQRRRNESLYERLNTSRRFIDRLDNTIDTLRRVFRRESSEKSDTFVRVYLSSITFDTVTRKYGWKKKTVSGGRRKDWIRSSGDGAVSPAHLSALATRTNVNTFRSV